MPRGELLKCLVALSVFEKRTQHRLQNLRKGGRGDAGEDLSAHSLIFPEAAADKNVITIHALAADLRVRGETADVTQVMLCARVRAAGDVDVHWLIQLNALFQILCQFERVPLGV